MKRAAAAVLLAALPAAQEPPRTRPPLPSPAEIAALPPDGGPEFNRLVFETSPYLLQHARNPVDWYPWGEEAFERARKEDRLVFLSIGYSTCHWCHVMERESFEDPEVAALLETDYVAVKVDREERPDVDHVYMSVVQAVTGNGGWPMTLVLTPDRRPVFAATYLPKTGRTGRPGLVELLPAIARAWREGRDDLLASADRVVDFLRERSRRGEGDDALDASLLDQAFTAFSRAFDEEHGGFGPAPKFPLPHQLSFLLRHGRRSGDPRAADMAVRTLQALARGGIHDQLGGGFHRYSTDAEWRLPHFEKMLYDQALLAIAYVEAWQVSGLPELTDTARSTLDYVLRDLADPRGGFHSAEDADSEGEEGRFYLWTPEELVAVLGEEDGALAAEVWSVVPGGNFRDQATGERTGRSILLRSTPLAAVAEQRDLGADELAARVESMRERLFRARERRVRPLKDDKVLTDWNGLAIAALSIAARALDEPRYADAARRAADFVLGELHDGDGRLLKRWRAGEAGMPAVLDDYAFLIHGLLELYETVFDPALLRAADRLARRMQADFGDPAGGFFLARKARGDLLVRPREDFDGALPAGASVAALDLLRLGRLTGDRELEELARRALASLPPGVRSAPSAHAQLLIALGFALGPTREVVVAGDPAAADTREALTALGRRFLPDAVVHLRPPGDASDLVEIAEWLEPLVPLDGRATAYVCTDFTCALPTTSLDRLLASLEPARADPK